MILAGGLALCSAGERPAEAPHWQPWTDDLFAQARQQHRFVLLDLEAVWCHWCHVMEEITYRDPAVLRLLESHYISVRVDQDSRPDLSNRYEDYGWPATVVFDESGQEIVKRQGYMPPKEMSSMLEAIVRDPSPGPSVQPERKIEFSGTPALDPAVRAELIKANDDGYDSAAGGWGQVHKYVDGASLDYEFERALAGDAEAERRVRQTLTAALKLIDPVWGGASQYSVGGTWNEPHYEKIMSIQADNMRVYALAGAAWHVPAFEQAALDIQRYVAGFLTGPDGAFYVSQDADLVPGEHSDAYFALDDAARRGRGIPRVDRHVYARENGWMIESLAALYGVTGRDEFLLEAVRAAVWAAQNRALPGGGFRHDAGDSYGPYLGDTLTMGRAFLALYAATADRHWLERARQAASFIGAHFADASGAGFDTTARSTDPASRPRQERDENIALARFANLLVQYTGDAQPRAMAESAMKYLVTPEVARRLPAAGVLLADAEAGRAPLHITIVGHKDDAAARGLFLTALSAPSLYERVEWWDVREGPLPNPDVEYPQMKRAAAFLCTEGRCSLPSFDTVRFAATIERARNGR
jgi:uncharacterized protein YyaL (SSP411 family)